MSARLLPRLADWLRRVTRWQAAAAGNRIELGDTVPVPQLFPDNEFETELVSDVHQDEDDRESATVPPAREKISFTANPEPPRTTMPSEFAPAAVPPRETHSAPSALPAPEALPARGARLAPESEVAPSKSAASTTGPVEAAPHPIPRSEPQPFYIRNPAPFPAEPDPVPARPRAYPAEPAVTTSRMVVVIDEPEPPRRQLSILDIQAEPLPEHEPIEPSPSFEAPKQTMTETAPPVEGERRILDVAPAFEPAKAPMPETSVAITETPRITVVREAPAPPVEPMPLQRNMFGVITAPGTGFVQPEITPMLWPALDVDTTDPVPGNWPDLLDDAHVWAPAPPRVDHARLARLEAEQKGRPWNA